MPLWWQFESVGLSSSVGRAQNYGDQEVVPEVQYKFIINTNDITSTLWWYMQFAGYTHNFMIHEKKFLHVQGDQPSQYIGTVTV